MGSNNVRLECELWTTHFTSAPLNETFHWKPFHTGSFVEDERDRHRFTGAESNQSVLLSLRNSSPETLRSVPKVTATQTTADSRLLVPVHFQIKWTNRKCNWLNKRCPWFSLDSIIFTNTHINVSTWSKLFQNLYLLFLRLAKKSKLRIL